MSRKQIRKDLEELHIGQNTEKQVKKYYSQKKREMLLLVLVGIILWSVVFFNEIQKSKLLEENTIFRNENGEGMKEVWLEVKPGDGRWQEFSMELYEKEYEKQELEEKFLTAKEQLSKLILGENKSLDYILTDLNLIQEMEGYPFILQWESSKPEIVDSMGNLMMEQIPLEGVEVELTAVFKCEEWQEEEKINIRAYPKVKSDFIYGLKEKVKEQETGSRKKLEFHLPKRFEEKELQWRYVKGNSGIILGVLFLILLPFIYQQKDREIHKLVKLRRKELQRQYPEFISKLILYVEAGMNVNSAIFRIAEDYQRKKNMGKPKSYLYEEVLYVCRQYKNGLSEKASYELLGKRCNLPCYKKLTGLLTQYLQKGGYGILENLRMEVTCANEERKKQIKKQGEEMSTKLLLPMIMMLGIVMVLIMIPACFSFQM